MTIKVFSTRQMAAIEAAAFAQGFSDQEFMEKAGKGIAAVVIEYCRINGHFDEILLLCGKGNNSGDAFVAGCQLLEKQFNVRALHPIALEECSPLCRANALRFKSLGGKNAFEFKPAKNALLIDGLFGTGFKGIAKDPYASMIQAANQSGCPILAIDIPSGLNGTTGETEGPVINADLTIYLGHPKTGFFLKEGWNAVGRLERVDFGLPASFSEKE
ncbi:MAG: NAD(P)H-hydrate epimerase, partial [Parachlamydia sp.]|nr:NAD(P)H-hydrate epimerase [Parachlamydia sp.]